MSKGKKVPTGWRAVPFGANSVSWPSWALYPLLSLRVTLPYLGRDLDTPCLNTRG